MANRNTISDLDDLLLELDSSQFDSLPSPVPVRHTESYTNSEPKNQFSEIESLAEKFEDMPRPSSTANLKQVNFEEPDRSSSQFKPTEPVPQPMPTPVPQAPPKVSEPVAQPPPAMNTPPAPEPQNRQSVYVSTAPASGNCARCQQPISGEHVLALGKMWHTNHLNCSTCNKGLQGEFFDHNNNYICKECMERDFRCSKCQQPITGEYFTGNGLKLHPHCVTRNRCHKCGEEIPGGETSALGKFWHSSCFSCFNCAKPLDTTFYPKNNEPFCRECASGTSGGSKSTSCSVCGQGISGSYVAYQNKNYHDNCFKCTGCANILDSTQFYNINNNPHCYSCAHK